jgi:hypothetical protein
MDARGGKRKGAGRKSNAQKLLEAQETASSIASWFTPELQKSKWQALLNSEDEAVQFKAISYLSDRLYGRAAQSVDMNISGTLNLAETIQKARLRDSDSPTA